MQQGCDFIKKYLEILKTASLFTGLNDSDLIEMLNCLGANKQNYEKDSIVISVGNRISSVGIVLSGSANIIKEDINGNRNIISELKAGDLFAEVFACSGAPSSISVTTQTNCEVLFVEFEKVINTCSSTCKFNSRLIENMLKLIAFKNIQLHDKIDILSKRSTREKLMEYFYKQVDLNNNHKFKIPFSRNEMADFLCVDRSSLSRELGKMRDEGIINFNKNSFEVII
jgi:CRP-like cAMP-binding protein